MNRDDTHLILLNIKRIVLLLYKLKAVMTQLSPALQMRSYPDLNVDVLT